MFSDDVTSEAQTEPTQPAATPEPVAEAAPPPPPPRFEVQPYVPDGNFPPLGLALALGGGLMAAVLIGFLVSIIARWFYLVLFFPAVIGLTLGVIGALFIKVGKVRNPLLASIAACLNGIMAMGTMHYVNYQRSLDAVANAAPFDQTELENRISFFKYLDLRAEEGVTISRVARNEKGLNLGYIGSYIYWLVEVLGVAAIAWAVMRAMAAAPFCAACNTWKEDRRLARMALPAEDMAVRAVEGGDVLSLLQCAGLVQAKGGHVLKAVVCPCCGVDGGVEIVLDRLHKNSKGEWNEWNATLVTRMTYPGEVLQFLPGASEK